MFGFIGDLVGGLLGNKKSKDANSANLKAVRETNDANLLIAKRANDNSNRQARLAYQRDTLAAREARGWDRKQVLDARKFDQSQVLAERKWNQSVASLADTRDRTRFVQDRSHSENLARLAEGRDRANFLENRVYEAQQGLSAEAREQSRFLENRNWTEKTAMDAELRQRGYQQADLEGARAYADPAAERARLEAAGFNPLGRADSSSGMNNIGGAIANAPAAMPSVGSAGVASFSAPAARAAEAMGMPGAIVPSAAGSASSQIARSQMAHMGVFDPAVAFMQAPIMQADNSLGEGLADAFASYESQKLQEKEFALRKSQLEIEQARMSELMQRATMRPIVGGVFSDQVGDGRAVAAASGAGSSPAVPRLANSGYAEAADGSVSPSKKGKPVDYNDTKKVAISPGVVQTDSGTSDAQVIEDRYGDVASSAIGVGILAGDLGVTVGNKIWGSDEKRKAVGKKIRSFFDYGDSPASSSGGRVRYRAQRDVSDISNVYTGAKDFYYSSLGK